MSLKYFIFVIVDGLKENSLYVSAGPRDDEKPEVAVYAAVAKKLPQSDNNSNLYADVKKSGRQETNKGTMSSEVKPKKGTIPKIYEQCCVVRSTNFNEFYCQLIMN